VGIGLLVVQKDTADNRVAPARWDRDMVPEFGHAGSRLEPVGRIRLVAERTGPGNLAEDSRLVAEDIVAVAGRYWDPGIRPEVVRSPDQARENRTGGEDIGCIDYKGQTLWCKGLA